MDGFWVTVGDVELGLLALGGVLFLLLYTVTATWWRIREGWFIFLCSVGLTALFAYIFAGRVGWLAPLDDGGVRVVLRVVIFTGFGIALMWIGTLLLLAQREQRRHTRRARRTTEESR